MKLLFSESEPDYGRYLYPYVVWAVREAAESPADLFERGFLPAAPGLDRFYLGRSLRVDLTNYRPSSENRRILRKGKGCTAELVPRSEFDYHEERRRSWKQFADQRFGEDIMSFDRLDRLMHAPVIDHLLVYREASGGDEVGAALLYLEVPRMAYYYYAFYRLDRLPRNLGMFMMTTAVGLFAERGVRHLYLGTCYSERALYKAQFAGLEFFNGNRWSKDVEELKYLVRRQPAPGAAHLLQDQAYLDRFWGGGWADLANSSSVALGQSPD